MKNMSVFNQAQMAKNNASAALYCKNVQFIDEHNYVYKAKLILKVTGNLRLKGDTGAGKTTLVHRLAELFNLPLFEMVLTSRTTNWDLLGTDILAAGNTNIRNGIVLEWLLSEGGILYLDGFNYADPSIVALLESLADFRKSVWIPELKKTFVRSDKHLLVISYNPSEKSGYSGTYLENIATIRRFEGLVVDYLSPLHERKLINEIANNFQFAAKWVELGRKTREMFKENKLKTPLTTGNLINYAKFYTENMAEDDILEIASSLYPEDELSLFKKCFEDSSTIDVERLKSSTS